MDKEKVFNLAKLARIELGDGEAENLTREFGAILDYVGEVKEVNKSNESDKFNKEEFPIHNVMREDAEPHESGFYTKKILKQAPAKEGSYIKVKKIL